MNSHRLWESTGSSLAGGECPEWFCVWGCTGRAAARTAREYCRTFYILFIRGGWFGWYNISLYIKVGGIVLSAVMEILLSSRESARKGRYAFVNREVWRMTG